MASLQAGGILIRTSTLLQPCRKSRFCQVRAQSYRDESKHAINLIWYIRVWCGWKLVRLLACSLASCIKMFLNQSLCMIHVLSGRWSDTVDANLHVLRERIEEVKMKERCRVGWNYAPLEISTKAKRDEEWLHFLRLVGTSGATFGLTLLSCTLFLCITSLLLLHLNQWLLHSTYL